MRASRKTIIVRSALSVLAVLGIATTATACDTNLTGGKHTSKPSATPTPQANTVVLTNNIDPCKLVSSKLLRKYNHDKPVKIKDASDATSANDLYRRRCDYSSGAAVSTLREPKGSKLVYNEFNGWHLGSEGVNADSVTTSELKAFPRTDAGSWIYERQGFTSLTLHTIDGVTLYFQTNRSGGDASNELTEYARQALKNPSVVNPGITPSPSTTR